MLDRFRQHEQDPLRQSEVQSRRAIKAKPAYNRRACEAALKFGGRDGIRTHDAGILTLSRLLNVPRSSAELRAHDYSWWDAQSTEMVALQR